MPRSRVVTQYFREFEPDLLRDCQMGRLQCRRYWAAGVNDVISVDQHDKWKRYGLALHLGLDHFPGKLHWLKIWWTNNNPKLIASFYLDNVVKCTGRQFNRIMNFHSHNLTQFQFRHVSPHSK